MIKRLLLIGVVGNIKLNSEGSGKLTVVDNNKRWSLEKTGKKA